MRNLLAVRKIAGLMGLLFLAPGCHHARTYVSPPVYSYQPPPLHAPTFDRPYRETITTIVDIHQGDCARIQVAGPVDWQDLSCPPGQQVYTVIDLPATLIAHDLYGDTVASYAVLDPKQAAITADWQEGDILSVYDEPDVCDHATIWASNPPAQKILRNQTRNEWVCAH